LTHSRLLVNLAFLSQKPTGLSNYALNLFPHLWALDPLILCPEFAPLQTDPKRSSRTQFTSPQLSPDQGLKGHLRRLLWTQFRLPHFYRQHQSPLLFCPIPEAPLGQGCSTVVMVHDFIPLRFSNPRSFLSLYFKFYLPWILKQSRHILCNSQSTAADIQHFCGIADRHITVIPLAYNTDRYYPQNLPHQNYFLYIGRPDPHKNLRRVLEAFVQIAPQTDAELWIGGSADPRYTPALQSVVAAHDLRDRVKFLGYIPDQDLPLLLNQSLALIFPSLWEGFGLPVLEAMACGTPVITSNQSALPEVAGEAALLVDPYKVGSIAEAMEAIVNEPGLRQALRQRGLVQAQQFSWQKTGAKTIEVLSRFL
jgi:glycosyltransferase involved in cell wall biosynthesis